MKDRVQFPGGNFELSIYQNQTAYERGEVLRTVRVHNKMTTASFAVIAGLVGNTGSQTAFGYLALGTSTTAVSAAHTGLQAEISTNGLQRAVSVNSRTTTTQTNDTLNFVFAWTATGVSTVQEIGIFNAAAAGTMLARALTGAITTASGNVLTGTYTWQVVGN